jgi:hypothetical protein
MGSGAEIQLINLATFPRRSEIDYVCLENKKELAVYIGKGVAVSGVQDRLYACRFGFVYTLERGQGLRTRLVRLNAPESEVKLCHAVEPFSWIFSSTNFPGRILSLPLQGKMLALVRYCLFLTDDFLRLNDGMSKDVAPNEYMMHEVLEDVMKRDHHLRGASDLLIRSSAPETFDGLNKGNFTLRHLSNRSSIPQPLELETQIDGLHNMTDPDSDSNSEEYSDTDSEAEVEILPATFRRHPKVEWENGIYLNTRMEREPSLLFENIQAKVSIALLKCLPTDVKLINDGLPHKWTRTYIPLAVMVGRLKTNNTTTYTQADVWAMFRADRTTTRSRPMKVCLWAPWNDGQWHWHGLPRRSAKYILRKENIDFEPAFEKVSGYDELRAMVKYHLARAEHYVGPQGPSGYLKFPLKKTFIADLKKVCMRYDIPGEGRRLPEIHGLHPFTL